VTGRYVVGTDDEVLIWLDVAGQHRDVANRGHGYDTAEEQALGRFGERCATIDRGDERIAQK
jgi:hypothetical protein